MKKIIAILVSFVMALTFASCGISKADEEALLSKLDSISGQLDSILGTSGSAGNFEDSDDEVYFEDGEEATGEVVTDASGEAVTDAAGEVVTKVSSTSKASETKKASYLSDVILFKGVRQFIFDNTDPKTWSKEKIVACYSSGMAMEDHDGVETDQLFQLSGDLPGATKILKGPINLAMKLGAQPFPALTGGYWDLRASDLKNATARREGDYIVICLYPKVQTDGPKGNEHEGTVGHVCNVVQDIDGVIGYIEQNFRKLDVEYDDEDVKLVYNNAYAKDVKINTKTGKMESGTWGYDVDIYLDDCTLAGVTFDDFHTTITWKCWYPVTKK